MPRLLANLFNKNQGYTSASTQFLCELIAHDPQLVPGQRQGRAKLWDRSIDRLQRSEERRAAVDLPSTTHHSMP